MKQKRKLHVCRQKLNPKAAADAEKAVVETGKEAVDQLNAAYRAADQHQVVADQDKIPSLKEVMIFGF
jgi:hypothetical protein